EHHVFEQLSESYPGLLEQLRNGSKEEILHVGELIGKGAAGARGNNTKMLKSAVLNWIAPKGEAIQPPLHRNSKIDHRFNHELSGSLLFPVGLDWNDPHSKLLVCRDQWPVFLYAHHTYDAEDPWCGLLRSFAFTLYIVFYQAYKHVFTSLSLVDREPKAMWSRNACLHGMNSITVASMAYIATQIQFALSLSLVFSRTDMVTDLETFYHSLLNLLEDSNELKEVDKLLVWWKCQVFPTSAAAKQPITANSTLLKIQQKCFALKQISNPNVVTS
ncbi:hypothetical protein BDR04DRAFT_1021556, partial [Suillus decipiens]